MSPSKFTGNDAEYAKPITDEDGLVRFASAECHEIAAAIYREHKAAIDHMFKVKDSSCDQVARFGALAFYKLVGEAIREAAWEGADMVYEMSRLNAAGDYEGSSQTIEAFKRKYGPHFARRTRCDPKT